MCVRPRRPTQIILTVFLLATTAKGGLAEIPKEPAGSGDLGALESLAIGPDVGTGSITIRGRHARQQLFVTGVHASGRVRDVTHQVKYATNPSHIISVDETGLITPLDDGQHLIINKQKAFPCGVHDENEVKRRC